MNKIMALLYVLLVISHCSGCASTRTEDSGIGERNMAGSYLRMGLRHRYPNAVIHVLDSGYSITDKETIADAYSSFIFEMRSAGLSEYIPNKLDCDKWALLFKAYVTAINAMTDRDYALPVGMLMYLVNGDPRKPHCINVFVYDTGEGFGMLELEPQPNNGIGSLTIMERRSAWLVVI